LTTVSEFEEWQAYFQERLTFPEKEDHYAAATIRAIFAAQGGKAGKISDYLLKFEAPRKKQAAEQDSKSVWLAIFGIAEESA
jgi:hypothetical protein